MRSVKLFNLQRGEENERREVTLYINIFEYIELELFHYVMFIV